MIPISAPTKVGPTKVLCPVILTIRPKPSSVKAICTKTPSVMSASTLAAASGRGVPLIPANRGGRHKCADRFTYPAHPKQLPQRGTFGLWKKDPPCKRVEKYWDCEMESYDCGNGPTCSSEGCADLWQPLPDEQDREERRSGKAKQPYGHVYFAQCFHPFSETIRARVRSCAYPKREQIYAEQRPISSGDFAQVVLSLRRAPRQVR